MTHNPETQNTQQREVPGPEPPRIYVASLSDYNNGRLHGSWIDAARDDEYVWADINNMLETSTQTNPEEFAIHDFEGFAGWQPGEYESISVVTAVARAIAEHGPAIASWIDYRGDATKDTMESFAGAYLGEWASMSAYAEHIAEDIGVKITVEPESWSHYVAFNTEALGRDLSIELATDQSPDGGLYVFDPNID